ncbi:Sestrin [Amphibalanus amphitrite]|uniref:Sestrin n=1 Tax=Amphibalanus amphitrite TaxID=1232801 RepID=A0A6A4VKY4_AMPAM|nr:Sestrin [Amphibalanus amphitrite]
MRPGKCQKLLEAQAAELHQCQALMEQLQDEFLASGGEPRWLEGLHLAPKKLQDLSEVNKTLAHRPWLLSKAHIERLVRGRDNWSLGELLQALTILAHYHAASSFVHGCRVVTEPCADAAAGKKSGSSTPGSGVAKENGKISSSPPRGVPVDELMHKIKSLRQQAGPAGPAPADSERPTGHERVDGEPAPTEVGAGRRLADTDDPHVGGDSDWEEPLRRTDGGATFRVQDYNWEDHGFSLVNRLYSDVGYLLDDKFRKAYHLTYQTMGSFRAVDTRPFRRAIWRYIQCLYGIRHDDYDYKMVSELLDRRLKELIKTTCVSPELLDSTTPLSRVMAGFQRSEKIHVVILCLEARLQSELLYALRAVMRYTT